MFRDERTGRNPEQAVVRNNCTLHIYCFPYLIMLWLGVAVIRSFPTWATSAYSPAPCKLQGSDAVAVFGGVGRVCVGELVSIGSSAGLRIGPSSSSNRRCNALVNAYDYGSHRHVTDPTRQLPVSQLTAGKTSCITIHRVLPYACVGGK